MRAPIKAPSIAMIDSDSGFTTVLRKRLDAADWRHVLLESMPPVSDLAAMRLGLVVVDPTVLGSQPWESLEQLTTGLPMLGVLVCTSQSTVAQRVRGFRLGVDDWVTKPCHPEEVLARAEAILRRHQRANAETISQVGPLVAGELEFRLDRFEVLAAGSHVELTRREFELLLLLAQSDGRVLPRDEVYQRVWGYAMVRGDRSVDVFVRRIRQKLERVSPGWNYIHTHFGIGYRFDPEPSIAEGAAAESAPEVRIAEGADRPAGYDAEVIELPVTATGARQ